MPDYYPVSGVLTFDDSEMSKTIFVPIYDDYGTPQQNRDFTIVLTNVVLDAAESTQVQSPRLDQTFSQALVRILDTDIDPKGFSRSSILITNINPITLATNILTNTVFALDPTNGVFNFEKAHYRATRDISDYWTTTPITVYVNRMGTNNAASPTVYWRVNNYYLDKNSAELVNGEFPLQPGSDYATPDPVNNAGIWGLVSDFNFAGGYNGSVSWGAKDFAPKPITFSIYNNGLQQFNEDFLISLYEEDADGNPIPAGMVDQTTVTILYDDNHPPAGAVDEYYNSDYNYNMLAIHATVPPQMSHPGTDGEVYGLAVQPDNKTVIVGDFYSYNQTNRNYIARINTDGSLDATFNPGSGPNNYVNSIALMPNNKFVIGGPFSSYNGLLRNGIAVVMPNGALDSTFNPGQGFNGTVYALAFQANGEILVGGNFTAYNGVPRHYLALLNTDGSLDRTFDPGTNLNAAVYAIAATASGQVIVGGEFTSVGGITGQDRIARFNADGSFDASFDPGSGANGSVYALGIQPNGNIVMGGEFSKVNGQSANSIARLTVNGFTDANFYSGVGVDGPVYSLTIQTNPVYSTTNSSLVVQSNFTIYVGGGFTSVNGTHRLGFARLNPDGTVDTTFLDTAYNQFAGLPREHFNDPVGTVLASGIQSDGNVMIGGSFQRVGGGQSDDFDVRPESTDTNNLILQGNYGYSQAYSFVQKTRAGIRNRSNIARLVGGATPGPGNIGLLYGGYSINKSQSPMYVSLIRTNGNLGPAAANFAVLPVLAQSGQDYSYVGYDPIYWDAWQYVSPMGRMHSDGFFGTNGMMQDVYGRYWVGSSQLSSVNISIFENTNSLSNLSAQFQLSNPIGADQFYLGGEDIPLGVALGESAAPFTLIDDHHTSGTFGFSSSSYVGTGQSAPITIVRTNGSYGIVYLSYATTTNGSTAILGSDYSAASGTLTFQPGDKSHTFTVPILNSNWNSSVEKTVNLSLFGLNPPVNGLAAWSLSNAVLRLVNPNFQGYLSLNTNAYLANLSGGSVTITVNRSVGSKGTLNVLCASVNGTAVSGTDYLGFTNVLQWNNGDVTPRTITVPLANNGLVGVGKQFGVVLSNPLLNGNSSPALFATNAVTNALVFINNDNSYGSLQFSAPSYVVNENGGYATITVIRTGGTNGTASVNYTTIDATAYAGTNYLATTNTLTFIAGQVAASFTVPLIDDGKVNPAPGAFYFNVALSNPSEGAALGSITNVPVNIVDAESFNRPAGGLDTTFNTGAGMNGDVFALALQSSGQLIAGGNFTIVNGVPENYLARLNADGSLDRSGFLYGLAGANGPVYALVNQTDDQLLVGGAFTNFNGTVLNSIARLNTDGSLDSSFNPGAGADNTVYALAETFINGARKIYAAGAFASLNGAATPFVARLNNDGTVDSGFVTSGGPNAVVYAVAAYPTNSPFAGKVLIGGAFTNVNKTVVGRVARLNVDGSVDTTFNSNLSVGAGDVVRAIAIQSDGAVLIGGDFTNFDGVAANHVARLNVDGTLDAAFAANVGSGANATVSAIQVQADNRIVLVGQFTKANGVTRNRITRLLPTGAVDPTINFGDGANGAINALLIQPADQMLVIGGTFTQYDDQTAGHIARIYGGSIAGSGAFTFTASGYQVDENGIQALIGIRRTGGTSGTNADNSGSVAVNFVTTDGTAHVGIDYSNVNAQVVFPAGEVLEYVSVPVLNDSNSLQNLTVNLSLVTNVLSPAGLGDQSTAVLTIVNDDSAVSFGAPAYTVPKNILTGIGTIDVVRLGSSSGTSTVDLLTTTNGSAVPGVDFIPTNFTVVFNPGQTDVVVQIPLVTNNVPGGNRTVVFALTNVVNTLLYSPSNTVLTIIDTVVSPGQLSFAASNFVANANAGYGYLTVVRTNGLSGSVSASFNTVPGTALPGVNYATASGSVTFNAGQSNAVIAVPIITNYLAEGPVSLSVVLSNPTGGATLINPTNAALTIINTNVVIAFAAATNTYPETVGTAFINVLRYNNTNGSSVVQYATADGTATNGLNYLATAGTLTFNPGQSIVSIPVPVIHDTNVTGTVAFSLSLTNAGSGVRLATPSVTTVQLLDAEAGLSFTTNAATVSKNTGNAIITVVCSNPSVEPVVTGTNVIPLSVNYSTTNGTAVAGVDYVATSGTLVFTNGNGTNTFNVPIINNSLVNGSHSFTVNLAQPTAPGVLVAPSVQTVTIVDNNSGLSFSSPVYSVLRSGVAATITVVRTDNTNNTSTVNFSTINGTGTAGVDYVATNGVLVFTNGVTSQTFTVTVIPSTAVQPDKTVMLQLSGATNGFIVAPYVATLTIHDTSGSFVVPSGATFAPNGDPNHNGIIDPGETVSLFFAFRDAGGNSVSNLSATLLPMGGVTSPSPSTAVNYGALTVDGPAVFRQFSFTAAGTNSQQITANFRLQDGNTSLGTNIFTFTLGSWTTSVTNTNAIIINANGIATPYPSTLTVTNINGVIIKTTVVLTNLSHTAASAISALLVSPVAQDTLLMGNAGGPNVIKNLTLTFDDAATNSLPGGASTNVITSGAYKPTSYGTVPNFP